MSEDRSWMYTRMIDGHLNPAFVEGVDKFVEAACKHPKWMDGEKIKCPCPLKKCHNRQYLEVNVVKSHLLKRGFIPGYYVWTRHGETEASSMQCYPISNEQEPVDSNLQTMVMDVVGPSFNNNCPKEETPNPDAKTFYDMLEAAKNPLFPDCDNHSQLSFMSKMLNLKAKHHLSEGAFDGFAQLFRESLPQNNLVPESFDTTKQLMRGLGLPVEKIDCCPSGCMIYWGKDINLTTCKICGQARYKRRHVSQSNQRRKLDVPFKSMYYFPLTPRLLRLYSSNATATEMRWHAEHKVEDGVMQHPSDAIAWQHFNNVHPEFSSEARNVRLGLCIDGFQPFGQTKQQYSCWPVILTVYNLPPWLCMKETSMFLTILVPGPRNPKDKLDVYLQPLITELKQLWECGVQAYDTSRKQNFLMRAALMWTISDFPAYAMLSGWSTDGLMACPYCMDESDAFTLIRSGKQSWFDNHRKFLPQDHPFRRNRFGFRRNRIVSEVAPPIMSGVDLLRVIDQLGLKKVTDEDAHDTNSRVCRSCGWQKRSIFWDLPYWSSNLIRHNLDVMHIEKNVFDNIFNTVLDIPGKTKDTLKSRQELNEYCKRPELCQSSGNGTYPKACYTIGKIQKQVLFEWMKGLKLFDGYDSNLGRCLNMQRLKLFGMTSHACHIFMQRLMPIAFRELLPNDVWEALTELSNFFKTFTTTIITNENMARLEAEIPIILCKLERIFPPSFFDVMEHLPVHLPYEARIGGPVQFRWMYPFERYLQTLKDKAGNEAQVESLICNAYLVEEASAFCSFYFKDHVQTKIRDVPNNYEGRVVAVQTDHEGNLSIFKYNSRPFGQQKIRRMTVEESKAAHLYVLLNCEEVAPFLRLYIDFLREHNPYATDGEVDKHLEEDFPKWFNSYAHDPSNGMRNNFLIDLAKGPLPTVRTYDACFVNGYKFHTLEHGSSKGSMNSGVCVKGTNYSVDENDFYGQLMEVVEIEYQTSPLKRTVLFKCEWFDPTPSLGIRVHNDYGIVMINHRRRYKKYEPFILASQATQVYYCSYPSIRRDKVDWWVVLNVKARDRVITPKKDIQSVEALDLPPFQEESVDLFKIGEITDDVSLVDPTGELIDIDDEDLLSEEELVQEIKSDYESERKLDTNESYDSDSE